jgi:type II secretory pathway pseudopilin PulG
MTRRAHIGDAGGFSLVEVLVASGLLATALVALAELFVVATHTNATAHTRTLTAILASQKVEQLRALTWGEDAAGVPISDRTSNLAVTPAVSSGGTGLDPSPAGTLDTSTPGFVDYLDAFGTWAGTGETPPAGSVFVRRWSIEPLPTSPGRVLVLQVVVSRVRAVGHRSSAAGRLPDEARLVSIKTRKSAW